MDWIDNGYMLLWETVAPAAREFQTAPSEFNHKEFVNGAIEEMVEEGALTRPPKGQRPSVISLIRMVRKPRSDKVRIVINMRYMNTHFAKKVFNFEEWSDLADIDEKGEHTVSYDLKSGYCDVGLHLLTRRFVGIKWEGVYYVYTCLPFELSTAP
jgi:hypothetical protein